MCRISFALFYFLSNKFNSAKKKKDSCALNCAGLMSLQRLCANIFGQGCSNVLAL